MRIPKRILRTSLRFIVASAPPALRDFAGIAGAALIAYGAWRIYAPAGYIAGGTLLIAGAFLSAFGGE